MLFTKKDIVIYKNNFYIVIDADNYNANLKAIKYKNGEVKIKNKVISLDNMNNREFYEVVGTYKGRV